MRSIVLITGAIGYTHTILNSLLVDLSKINFLDLASKECKPQAIFHKKIGYSSSKKNKAISPHIHHRFRQGNRRRTNTKNNNFE